jgi:hypothetical protein
MLRAQSRNAIYYAGFDHGVKETTTWITARAIDPEGAAGEFRFLMRVVAGDRDSGARQPHRLSGP